MGADFPQRSHPLAAVAAVNGACDKELFSLIGLIMQMEIDI